MAALTALNLKNSGVNIVEKNSGVNGVEPERRRQQRRGTRKKAELTAFNQIKSGVNGGEPEK